MLIKLPLSRLKEKQSEMESIAKKMETINDARIKKLVEINADRDHTPAWKSTAAFPLTQSPELHALGSQMRLLSDVIEEQKGLWRDSVAMLRAAAVPERMSAVGTDAYGVSIAELNFMMSEAAQLSGDALQAAVDSAVLAQDWRRLHCLTVGRVDRYGRALSNAPGIDGTPLDCLPLPGRDEAEEIFHGCELAKIRAEGVLLNLSSGDLNPTADSSAVKLVRDSGLMGTKLKYAEMVKQRDRLRAVPSALERWELLKAGAPEEPTFEASVAAATARAAALS